MTNLEEQFMRQKDFVPHEIFENVCLHFIGAGGIGSSAALACAKIGAKHLKLYDYDTVELKNIPNQLLSVGAIGSSKVADLAGIVLDFAGEHINVVPIASKVTKESGLQLSADKKNIVICGPDNMGTRKDVYEIIKREPHQFAGLIDGRMASRFFRLYCINPNNADECAAYEKFLHDENDVEKLPCSDRSVFHTNLILAATIAENVRRIATHLSGEKEILSKAPKPMFEVIFDLINMNFMVNNDLP